MLNSLTIRNYAIIEGADLHFDPHLNIIIGETGAGKSILLGALGLILGKRADTSVLRNQAEKCFVEATFQLQNNELQAFFESEELDFETQTVIRREINAAGKSRAFINDTPVTLDVLRTLTEKLVDIHAQHETQNLLEKDFFIQLLDKIIKQNDTLLSYRSLLKTYKEKTAELKHFREQLKQFEKEYEFVSFQFRELEEANLSLEEWQGLEEELELLLNAEQIKQNLLQLSQLFDHESSGMLEQMAQAVKLSAQVGCFHKDLGQLHESLSVMQDELRENLRVIHQLEASTEANEERIGILSEKQNAVNRLLQKHHFQQFEDLIALKNELAEKLEKFSFSGDKLSELEAETSEILNQLKTLSKSLHEQRMKAAAPFAEQITAIIKDLGIPHGKVSFSGFWDENATPGPLGMDTIDLQFAPNKGSQLQTLDQVGSGGEKSRLMLAIKSLTAGYMELPTLIFDEIDTGISGEVALKVGQMLKQLGKNHQVITITHLPQVAAGGNKHFVVYKNHETAISTTEIKATTGEETVFEIAKMLSGDRPTEAAIENARNLMN